MPEGPEIRYVVEKIKPKIIGKYVTKIDAFSKRKVRIPNRSKVIKVYSQGKLLIIQTSDYYIHTHFGITGWVTFEEGDYTKYIIHFSKLKLYVDSMRKFTKISILKERTHQGIISKLGIDILKDKFTYDIFEQKLLNSSRNVSSFLLDQSIFCGIGNYIRNEALYLSKIHPEAKTDEIDPKKIKSLYQNIRYVAFSGLLTWLKDDKIKVPKDIKAILPKKLSVPYRFRVYNRDKDRRGNKVTFTEVTGRRTFYVKKIQKI